MPASNFYVSPLLTNVSLAYRNDNYVAEKIFPVNLVKKDTGQIATYTADNLRPEEAMRARGGRTNEVTHGVSIGAHYTLLEYALKELVPVEDEENADDPIRPRLDATENLTDRLWVIKEKDLSDKITATATMTRNTTLSGTSQWSDYNNSDPFGDIKTAKESVRTFALKKANTLILSHDALETLRFHPDIVAKFPGAALITVDMIDQALSKLFGLQNLVVGDAQYNSADEGQTDAFTDIWSKVAIVAYIEPIPRPKSRTLGFNYQRSASRVVDVAEIGSGGEAWDRKGAFIRVTDKYDQKLVDVNCGYLIKAAIA